MLKLGLKADSGPTALYVGKKEDSIRKRVSQAHLLESRTGSSTLRRSIGALLREKLDLRPQPRSHKRSERDITHYKFDPAGEARLSEWIEANVYVYALPSSTPKATEEKLIREHRPPLNLTGWANQDAAMIKSERKKCADLARTAD